MHAHLKRLNEALHGGTRDMSSCWGGGQGGGGGGG